MIRIHGKLFTTKELKGVEDLAKYVDTEHAFEWSRVEWTDSPADTSAFLDKLVDLQAVVLRYSRGMPQNQGGVFRVKKHWNGYCLLGDNFKELLSIAKNPPFNYIEWLTQWFSGRKWSIPVYIVFWGVPVVAGWIIAVKTVLEWLLSTE